MADSTTGTATRRKFIIDCDTGIDDSVALLITLQAKDIVDLIAVTCVNGNCSVDDAVRNTLITLKIAKQSVPVYRGCSQPLTVENRGCDSIHAADGLGGVANDYTPCDSSLHSGHAAVVLVELVNKYPGEITLVALGPLTNLAMAYRLDENFSSKLSKLVIMGGNTEGKGNVQLAAEFNFHVDPEAAKIVLEETKCHCQICGWELCGLHNTFSWDWFDLWLAKAVDEKGEFIKKMLSKFCETRRRRWPKSGFAICDPLAVAVALYPDIVSKSTFQRATVETAGHSTRGMLVPEWREGLFPRDTKPVELLLEVDKARHMAIFDAVMESH